MALLSLLINGAPVRSAPAASDEEARRRQATVMLRDAQGQLLGSGVVVAAGKGGHWIATSRHVVEEQQRLCVVAADGQAAAAVVVPPPGSERVRPIDLALLWLPEPVDVARQGRRRAVSELAGQKPVAEDFPVVTASGYPASSHGQPMPLYSEARGLLLPLLKQRLQGGFDLSSTAAVQKGMSGGGLYLGARLIGINGTHADPLWPGELLSESGTPIGEGLNRRLELVSLAISASTIQRAVRAAVIPAPRQLHNLATVGCDKQALFSLPKL